jgi:hypothetical protein
MCGPLNCLMTMRGRGSYNALITNDNGILSIVTLPNYTRIRGSWPRNRPPFNLSLQCTPSPASWWWSAPLMKLCSHDGRVAGRPIGSHS